MGTVGPKTPGCPGEMRRGHPGYKMVRTFPLGPLMLSMALRCDTIDSQ
jgi:hypothetical protein